MEKQVAEFKVNEPGFFDGTVARSAGEVIRWEKPDKWDDAKLGKHFTAYNPSLTFEPLNETARELLVKARKDQDEARVKAKTAAADPMVLMLQLQIAQLQLEIEKLKKK